MEELFTQFDGVFFEKTRLSIITVLYGSEELSFNGLKRMFALSDGSVYAHLQKLLDGGYVAADRQVRGGRAQTWYTLTDRGRSAFRRYVSILESVGMEGTK